jgi:hypothetical protein
VHCFQSEPSEIFMHPLRTAFNVSDDNANRLFVDHALWSA